MVSCKPTCMLPVVQEVLQHGVNHVLPYLDVYREIKETAPNGTAKEGQGGEGRLR